MGVWYSKCGTQSWLRGACGKTCGQSLASVLKHSVGVPHACGCPSCLEMSGRGSKFQRRLWQSLAGCPAINRFIVLEFQV